MSDDERCERCGEPARTLGWYDVGSGMVWLCPAHASQADAEGFATITPYGDDR